MKIFTLQKAMVLIKGLFIKQVSLVDLFGEEKYTIDCMYKLDDNLGSA